MKRIRRGSRLLTALGLAFFGLMLLAVGIPGIAECSRPPVCSEDGVGMAASSLLFGFLSLLGAGQLAFKSPAGVEPTARPRTPSRFGHLRNFAWLLLSAVLAITGVGAAMILGPAYIAISSGPAAERSEGIVVALVGAPLAFACLLGIRWIQQRTHS